MGSIPHAEGVAFRVWVPNARHVWGQKYQMVRPLRPDHFSFSANVALSSNQHFVVLAGRWPRRINVPSARDHFACHLFHCMGNVPAPPLMHRFVQRAIASSTSLINLHQLL